MADNSPAPGIETGRQAAEFYAFLKTLETYRKIFTRDSTLVLSTDNDLFALLKHAAGKVEGLRPLGTPAQ